MRAAVPTLCLSAACLARARAAGGESAAAVPLNRLHEGRRTEEKGPAAPTADLSLRWVTVQPI